MRLTRKMVALACLCMPLLPAQDIWALAPDEPVKPRAEGLKHFKDVRCLKTGQAWGYGKEPAKSRIISHAGINASTFWPEKGETFTIQVAIGLFDEAKDIELMYELIPRPGWKLIPIPNHPDFETKRGSIRGLKVLDAPDLSRYRVQGRKFVRVNVPVLTLENREPQELLLYVAAYQNGNLVDWCDDSAFFSYPRAKRPSDWDESRDNRILEKHTELEAKSIYIFGGATPEERARDNMPQ